MEIDLASKTLFAEFQETVRSRASIELQILGTKTFVRKTVKGNTYWYEQNYINGQARQTYFGPSNKNNDRIVEEARQKFRKDKLILRKLCAVESRQAAMLRNSGLPVIDRRMAILLRRFSEVGLVHRHGVLVGTLAYTSYACLLGTIFEKATLMTQDIDIARDDLLEIAAPPINVMTLFSERGMECREVPPFSNRSLPSSYVTSDGIRIDFLVPLRGKQREKVVMPFVLGTGATALRFLDYLIDDPIETVLLEPSGGIPVTVPRPERYAIHKLIVAAYRPVTESAKKEKDLRQAAQLITALAVYRSKELKSAYRIAVKSGKKWEKAVRASFSFLPEGVRDLLK